MNLTLDHMIINGVLNTQRFKINSLITYTYNKRIFFICLSYKL